MGRGSGSISTTGPAQISVEVNLNLLQLTKPKPTGAKCQHTGWKIIFFASAWKLKYAPVIITRMCLCPFVLCLTLISVVDFGRYKNPMLEDVRDSVLKI